MRAQAGADRTQMEAQESGLIWVEVVVTPEDDEAYWENIYDLAWEYACAEAVTAGYAEVQKPKSIKSFRRRFDGVWMDVHQFSITAVRRPDLP